MRNHLRRCGEAAIGGVLASIALCAVGQDYPNRSIRLLVPYAPGGAIDISARVIAPRMSEALGRQLVVENRPGGSSLIATDLVAKSPADGYTLLAANISFGANPSLFRKLPYDTERDFAPVSMVGKIPTVLTVHPSVPVKTVAELVRLAQAKPGTLNYGSAGNGSANHLITEIFKSMTKTSMVHVPYKGGGPAVIDLVAGELSVMFATVPSSVTHIKNGRLVPLGVSVLTRLSTLPDVPTLAEAGVPGFDVYEWTALFAPAATPQGVIERLQREVAKVLANPEVKERFVALGADTASSTPKELAAHLKSELTRWAKLSKEVDIRMD